MTGMVRRLKDEDVAEGYYETAEAGAQYEGA